MTLHFRPCGRKIANRGPCENSCTDIYRTLKAPLALGFPAPWVPYYASKFSSRLLESFIHEGGTDGRNDEDRGNRARTLWTRSVTDAISFSVRELSK